MSCYEDFTLWFLTSSSSAQWKLRRDKSVPSYTFYLFFLFQSSMLVERGQRKEPGTSDSYKVNIMCSICSYLFFYSFACCMFNSGLSTMTFLSWNLSHSFLFFSFFFLGGKLWQNKTIELPVPDLKITSFDPNPLYCLVKFIFFFSTRWTSRSV